MFLVPSALGVEITTGMQNFPISQYSRSDEIQALTEVFSTGSKLSISGKSILTILLARR